MGFHFGPYTMSGCYDWLCLAVWLCQVEKVYLCCYVGWSLCMAAAMWAVGICMAAILDMYSCYDLLAMINGYVWLLCQVAMLAMWCLCKLCGAMSEWRMILKCWINICNASSLHPASRGRNDWLFCSDKLCEGYGECGKLSSNLASNYIRPRVVGVRRYFHLGFLTRFFQ